jgi:hypothetical protein
MNYFIIFFLALATMPQVVTASTTWNDNNTMKTTTGSFDTQKNKLTGASPRTLLEIDTDGGTLYYSDQALTVDAQAYVAKVMKWGRIRGQVIPGEEVVRISSMPVELVNNPRIDSDIRAGLEVRLFVWFDGLTTADKLLLFRGTISENIKWDIYKTSFTCKDIGEFWDKQMGTPLSADAYPFADPDDLGRIEPIVYGEVKYLPCLAIDAGAISALRSGLAEGDTTINLSDSSRFPDAGEDHRRLAIGDETNILYEAKSGNDLTGVTGIANDYPEGTVVMQHKALKFMAAGHPVKALANPRIIPTSKTKKEAVTIETGIALNTDDDGIATVEIASSAVAAIREKVGTEVTPTGHAHFTEPTNHWVEVADQLGAETDITSLAVHNDKLYGGTLANGKLYEWNGGNAWVEVAPKLGAETRIPSLASYNGKLYGGTQPNGKLYEWNDVDAWVEVAPKLGAVTTIPSLKVYNGKLYGTTTNGDMLYEWNDVNAWVKVANAVGDLLTDPLAVYKGDLYSGTYNDGNLYKWDGVSDWVVVAPQLGAEEGISSLAVHNGKLYGGTYPNGKLYEWNDVGAWVEVAGQLGAEDDIFTMAVFNGKLYGGTSPNGKLYEWNDSDAWVEVCDQLGAETLIHELVVYNNRLFGGTQPNGKLYEAIIVEGFADLTTITYDNDSQDVYDYGVIATNPDNMVDGNLATFATLDGKGLDVSNSSYLVKGFKAAAEDLGGGILRVRAKIKVNMVFTFDDNWPLEIKLDWKGRKVKSKEYALDTGDAITMETGWYTPDEPEWTDFNNSGTFIRLTTRAQTLPVGWQLYVYELWWEVETYSTAGGQTSITYLSLTGNSVADTLGGQLVIDADGYADDGAGHYTGVADALIEEPWDVFHHLIETYSDGAVHANIDLAGSFADAAANLPAFFKFGFAITNKIDLNRLLAMLAQQTWCRFIWEAGTAKLNRIKFTGTSAKSLNTDNDSILNNKRLAVNVQSAGLREIHNDIEVKHNLDLTLGGHRSPDAYEGTITGSDATSIGLYGTRQRTFLFFAVGDNSEMATYLQNNLLVFYKDIHQKVIFPSFLKHIELERGDVIDITTSQLGLSGKDHEIVDVDYFPPVPIQKQNPLVNLGVLEILPTPGWGGAGWGSQPWGT